MIVLAQRTGLQPGIIGRRYELLNEIMLWWAVFALGAACVLRAPVKAAVGLVVVVAIALRLAALAPVAPLSDDLYRYAWDGEVQAAGIDPYRYPPLAPELAELREEWLWPGTAECQQVYNREAGCTRINRPAGRTIYPPAAQVWFRGLAAVLPADVRDVAYQGAGLVVDLAVLAVLLALLLRWGRDPRWLVLYAWSPVSVLEAVQNAHVDGLAVLLTLLALAAVRARPVLAAGVLALATLVKLYPALLLVVLARRGRRVVAAAGAVFVAVVGLAYAPHVLAVGARVLGYLPDYLLEEDYTDGGRFLLLGALGLSGTAASVGAALVLLATLVTVLRRSDLVETPDRAALVLIGVLLLVTTPVQPWYALTVAVLAALTGRWSWLLVAAAGYPYFFSVILAGAAEPTGRISYGLAAAGVAAAWWRRRSENA